MTVFENIAFPLRMRRMPEATIREEVKRVLDVVQLPDVENRRPRQLLGWAAAAHRTCALYGLPPADYPHG